MVIIRCTVYMKGNIRKTPLVYSQHAATQPHNKKRRNVTECFNINITLARFSAGSLMMVEDRNM